MLGSPCSSDTALLWRYLRLTCSPFGETQRQMLRRPTAQVSPISIGNVSLLGCSNPNHPDAKALTQAERAMRASRIAAVILHNHLPSCAPAVVLESWYRLFEFVDNDRRNVHKGRAHSSARITRSLMPAFATLDPCSLRVRHRLQRPTRSGATFLLSDSNSSKGEKGL